MLPFIKFQNFHKFAFLAALCLPLPKLPLKCCWKPYDFPYSGARKSQVLLEVYASEEVQNYSNLETTYENILIPTITN